MSAQPDAPTSTPPGEGERRAQRGYGRQYQSSAAVIYAALERGDLNWVGVADRSAGIADDLVLGLNDRIVGHQFKTSQFPERFRLETLFMGADGLLKPLAKAWQALKRMYAGHEIQVCLVTNDYPSTSDALVPGDDSHSAAFLSEFELNLGRSLRDWRTTRWRDFVERLLAASDLDEAGFEGFLRGFRLLHGPAADFVLAHRLPPQAARLVDDIADVLPRLVSDPRDRDRWSRAELLHELGWRDAAIAHHIHQFPVGAHVQRNVETEAALRKAIQEAGSGYVALVGPPGAGKSTLLQTALALEAGVVVARYLAYVPGVAQSVGRGEADDFLDDVTTQLKRSGLRGVRFRDSTLPERREQFGVLLREAGERFQREKVLTLIVVDGLDHVPREEKPERSFLAELPAPSAVPEGLLFVLGTQRLDLEDLKPAVQDQAGAPGRLVPVSPLRPEAVHRMADLLGLDKEISREKVFELSGGHPLATRYLIEALRDADISGREALLAGAITFDGDIELVYESAWHGIRDDEEAKEVLAYIARAEAPMPLELLAKALPEEAIERALKSTKHLLSEGVHGWRIFHNSFRLFILGKPRMRLGKPDPTYSVKIYRKLAELAPEAPPDNPQRWLDLRYLARAQEHAAVLERSLPARFRRQLTEGRAFTDLQADIRLAFASAKGAHDAVTVYRLLLAADEIGRRWTALKEAPAVMEALLSIGDLNAAEGLAEEHGADGYKVVDALLNAGELDRARALFDRLEPLEQLLSGTIQSHAFPRESSGLVAWARRVIHFRDVDQIKQAIDRLSARDRATADDVEPTAHDRLRDQLRFEVAFAIVCSRLDADPRQIGLDFNVPAEWMADLLVRAGLRAEKLDSGAGLKLLREAVTQEGFAEVPNGLRRRTAALFARHGDIATAQAIFEGLKVPALSQLDDELDDDSSKNIARAVLEHAELAVIVGRSVVDAPKSRREVLRPLQLHANAVGALLGKASIDPRSIAYGEVARVARTTLAYLQQAKPRGSDEFHAMHQIAIATPPLGAALVRAAALCGEQEFEAVLAEFDRVFEDSLRRHVRLDHLRRVVAVEIYRAKGDADEATRRLEPLVGAVQEDTPAAQLESLATLAKSFAVIGNRECARDLLSQMHNETLGYALAPKKDPQYATWEEFLIRANAADPARRAERVALLVRQVEGMMETEGRSSAYRIASRLIIEAAMFNAGFGLATARALSNWGTTDWARLINALLLGMVKRRPDLVHVCIDTWCSLALPYYMEPYYHDHRLGEFIDVAIDATEQHPLPGVADTFQGAIEVGARAHERAALLERLRVAAEKKGRSHRPLDDAIARWKAESPPPRHSYTPTLYDDVTSLAELISRLEQDGAVKGAGYEAARAFKRLAPAAGFSRAARAFEQWPGIRSDSEARFVLINLAIDQGRADEARRLLHEFDAQNDDRSTWTVWMGGDTLRRFQALLRLDGSSVHGRAYEEFVGALAAGRESITSVLLEAEDIFPTITESPDWPGMWDYLAEQLKTTREHQLGHDFAPPVDVTGDEEAIAALFQWVVQLPLRELHHHAQVGALRLN